MKIEPEKAVELTLILNDCEISAVRKTAFWTARVCDQDA
jgi:hypothetical protein